MRKRYNQPFHPPIRGNINIYITCYHTYTHSGEQFTTVRCGCSVSSFHSRSHVACMHALPTEPGCHSIFVFLAWFTFTLQVRDDVLQHTNPSYWYVYHRRYDINLSTTFFVFLKYFSFCFNASLLVLHNSVVSLCDKRKQVLSTKCVETRKINILCE